MSRTIDERVVEMRFDNKAFESKAKETINTLVKLRESLNLKNAAKGLEGIEKAANSISLRGISQGVEELQKRFSTMGIVGMRVIENITDGLMNQVGRAVNFVSDSIVSGGLKRSMNIENAHFQLQALLKDETKVQAVMADAMESVDGTAYAYDEAAKAASQFAASGLEAGEEMLGALKGITGVAAMTNSDFESISQIFTTVAGNGRLMGDQLLQLSSRGLNVASTLSDYFKEVRGQSNMTEGAIREMVTKGQLDFKTFADAMTWAFGDSAKRANETFNGALSNMKSALARIGAGFFSPFVEQNGEMVKLFNTLREKINGIKSELVFDEQMDAIRGLSDEAKLLDETYARMLPTATEDLQGFIGSLYKATNAEDKFGVKTRKTEEYFQNMAESGNLTVDMLTDLDTWGLRATNSLREYLTGVSNGTIKATAEMTDAIQEMVGDITVLNSDVDRFTEEGKISYEMFKTAIVHYNRDAIESMDLFESTMKGMFAEVKKEGHVSADAFDEFAQNGINAQKAVKEYMMSVAKGETRATYAIQQEIENLSKESSFAEVNIRKFAEEGKISYDIFQAAMSEAYGEGQYASKRFTDAVLDNIAKVRNYIENFDVSTLMEAFYYGFESIINIGKGVLSVLSPIGEAFADVFFGGQGIIDLAAAMENFTAKLRLSEKGSKNLRDTFAGLFSIADLLESILFKLIGAFFKIDTPVEEADEGILGLTGSIGRLLVQITSLIKNSPKITNAITGFGKGVRGIINWISNGSKWIVKFTSALFGISDTESTVKSLSSVFRKVEKSIVSSIVSIRLWIKRLGDSFLNLIPENIGNGFKNFFKSFGEINWNDPSKVINNIARSFSGLKDSIGNSKFGSFGKNIKEFWSNITSAFSKDETISKIDKARGVLDRFTDWFKNKFVPVFGDASLGGILGAAGGIAAFYVIIGISNAIKKLISTINSIPKSIAGTFDALRDVMVAYQNDIKANTILKIAAAFGILAASLTVLSLVPIEKLAPAAFTFAAVAAVLMFGIHQLKAVFNAGKKVLSDNPIDNLINSLASSLELAAKKFSRALVIKSISKMVLDFGKSILMIAGSIVALGIMYNKYPDEMAAAMEAVLDIALIMESMVVLNGILAGLGSTLLGKKISKTMDAMGQMIASIGASMLMAVFAMNLLFKMDFPTDYPEKVAILVGLMSAMGALGYALNKSAKEIPKGNKVAGLLNPLVSIAILLVAAVSALKTLFKMDLPEDTGTRLLIFGGLIAGIGFLAYKLNEQAKYLPKGTKQTSMYDGMKSMILMLIGTVAAIKILFAGDLPTDWEQRMLMLEGIFVGMGVLVMMIGKAGDLAGGKGIKAGGSILALCLMLFSIIGAIKLIAMIPNEQLVKGLAALAVMFTGLIGVLQAISTITNAGTYKSVLSLAAILGALTASLSILSMIREDALWKAVGALTAVLIELAGVFVVMGKMGDIGSTWKSMLAMCGVVVVIAATLYPLALQPWDQLIAAAGALGGVLLVLSASLFVVSKSGVDIGQIGTFVLASLSVLPIALALGNLASSVPVDSLLPAALALSAVALALSASLFVVGNAGINLAGVLSFVAASLALIPIAAAFKLMEGLGWDTIAKGLVAMAGAMVVVGVGGSLLGGAAGLIIAGAGALVVFSLAIAALGAGLYAFSELLLKTIETISKLPAEFRKMAESFVDLGKWIMEGFAKGILSMKQVVESAIDNTFGSIIDKVKKIFDMHSPSKETEQIGDDFDIGFANGISKGRNTINDAVSNVFGAVTDKVKGFLGWGGKEVGEGYADDIGSGIESSGSKIHNKLSSLVTSSAVSAIGVAKDAGNVVGKETTEGFKEGTAGVSDILSDAMSSFTGNSSEIDMSSIGEMFGMNLSGGLMDGTGKIPADLQSAMDQYAGGMDLTSLYNTGLSGGEELKSGFDVGSIGLTDEMQDTLSENASGFDMSAYQQTGYEGSTIMLDGFASGFTDQVSDVASDSATGLQDNIVMAMTGNEGIFVNEGESNASKYTSGIKRNYISAITVGSELVNAVITGIEVNMPKYFRGGNDSALKYVEGLKEQFREATEGGRQLALSVLKGINEKNRAFVDAGSNAGAGFVEAIKKKVDDASAAGSALGKAASDATAKSLDEHSPSKIMGKIGDFAGIGFVGKLMSYIPKAYEAGMEIGDATSEGAKYGIRAYSAALDEISEPTLRPIMDLSSLRESAKEAQAMFNQALGSLGMNVESVSSMMRANQEQKRQYESDQNAKVVNNNFDFKQYNTSPKALSQIDIYRNTRNQFSQFKSEVNKK